MNALYYPFHLCHERTLERLLGNYQTVHFRDFMALQLTPLMGTTAFPDRMGDYYPEWVNGGRLVQGYDVSGAMKPETISAVDRDLIDPPWRRLFQEALTTDRRFQRGLFPDHQETTRDQEESTIDFGRNLLGDGTLVDFPFQVGTVQALSRQRPHNDANIRFEYGWALIKTAASLVYSIQLCQENHLLAVTDSAYHYHLLTRTCERDSISLENSYMKREGY